MSQTVSTAFGTVTDRQVTYYYKKGWFSGGNREDLPLRHITSVRMETARHTALGILCLLVGIGLLMAPGATKIVGILVLGLAALLLWGSPQVVLNTAGGDLRPATGLPWTRGEAETFVNAVRAQLFRDSA